MDSLFFTEEHKMIQRMVSEFAKDEIIPVARELDKNGSFPTEIVKKMAQLGLMEITREAIQIYGGYGYVHENDVERFFRDAKILEIVDGTSETQRLTISREIIKDKMA